MVAEAQLPRVTRAGRRDRCARVARPTTETTPIVSNPASFALVRLSLRESLAMHTRLSTRWRCHRPKRHFTPGVVKADLRAHAGHSRNSRRCAVPTNNGFSWTTCNSKANGMQYK
jgi:hypothetical protein